MESKEKPDSKEAAAGARQKRQARLLAHRYNQLSSYEKNLLRPEQLPAAGVDEAGRGPLAGPVVAAAVILSPDSRIEGIFDSKQLTPRQREIVCSEIMARSLAVSSAAVEPKEIDELNIYHASLMAMRRAVENLPVRPRFLLVDGNALIPEMELEQLPVVGGDGLCLSIAAASIVAKVTRDRLMEELEERYPGYGFAKHKGYPTRDHRDALRELGPSPVHRRSFTLLPQGEKDE